MGVDFDEATYRGEPGALGDRSDSERDASDPFVSGARDAQGDEATDVKSPPASDADPRLDAGAGDQDAGRVEAGGEDAGPTCVRDDVADCAGRCGRLSGRCGNTLECGQCRSGETCDPSGRCGRAPGCGPTTCPNGCCDASGTCVPGTEHNACGGRGGACVACTAEQACSGAACVAATGVCTTVNGSGDSCDKACRTTIGPKGCSNGCVFGPAAGIRIDASTCGGGRRVGSVASCATANTVASGESVLCCCLK